MTEQKQLDELLDGRDPDELVLYDMVEDHIARITLNRPEKRNAIIAPVMQELLVDHVRRAEDDDRVKVIILAGAGDHFCAGEDMRRLPIEDFGLKKGERLGQSPRMRGATKLHKNLDRLLLFSDKTTVVACQGATVGAGLHMALTADFVIAGESAYFGRPKARLGFAAFNTMLPVFMNKFGVNRAYDMLITGRTIDAKKLEDWGVAASVVPDDQLQDEALRYARAVSMHSTDGLMLGRKAMQMYWSSAGMGTWEAFMNVAHPLFTNTVWRDDEVNFLRERGRKGHMTAMADLKERWAELGFE